MRTIRIIIMRTVMQMKRKFRAGVPCRIIMVMIVLMVAAACQLSTCQSGICIAKEPISEERTQNADDQQNVKIKEQQGNSVTYTKDPYEKRAAQILSKMTTKQKVGQILFVGAPSNGVERMKKIQYGGYLFHANDFENSNKKKFRNRIRAIQKAAKINAFTAVDEEGGTVVRVSMYRKFSNRKYRSPRSYYSSGGYKAVIAAEKSKCKMLKSVGLNTNFAPDADVAYNSSNYMWSRSFSSNAGKTAKFISKTVTAMNKKKVVSVLKHFPGYGGNGNTHTNVIRDKRKLSTFKKRDLKPFKAGIRRGCGMIMMSHNIVRCLDKKYPASISPKVHKYLRKKMRYDGVIISDSLGMEGVRKFAKGPGPLAVKCFKSGADIVCAGDGGRAAKSLLSAVKKKKISKKRLDESVLRVLKLKLKMGIIK